MSPSGLSFTGQEQTRTAQGLNTNNQSAASSEYKRGAFHQSPAIPVEPIQYQVSVTDSDVSDDVSKAPARIHETNSHDQSAPDQNRSVNDQAQQNSPEQGTSVYYQDASDLQRPTYSQNQLAIRHITSPQSTTNRGRFPLSAIHSPRHLARRQGNRMQHSPPRRAYHEATTVSPSAELIYPSITNCSPSREDTYNLRISMLEATKKLVLSTLKAYGIEIKILIKDLKTGWAMPTANENLKLLYTADVRLTELKKLHDSEIRRFRRLEYEIEATWEDFMVPSEERMEEERDFADL